MLSIEQISMSADGQMCCTLNQAYDTGCFFSIDKKDKVWHSKKSGKLNLVDKINYYDWDQCYSDYSKDESEDSYLEDYIRNATHIIKEGVFLQLTDDNEGYLERDSLIHLVIDNKSYKLPCCFAPYGNNWYRKSKCAYYAINYTILKELAFSSSIRLSYVNNVEEKTIVNNVDISGFKEYAEYYYKNFYIENAGTPEEKEALQRELQAMQEAKRLREEEEKEARRIREEEEREARRIREEEEKVRNAEKRAERKAEWDNADPMSKIKIMLKRNWILVLLILIILLIVFG